LIRAHVTRAQSLVAGSSIYFFDPALRRIENNMDEFATEGK
jgi:hypothetical protein